MAREARGPQRAAHPPPPPHRLRPAPHLSLSCSEPISSQPRCCHGALLHSFFLGQERSRPSPSFPTPSLLSSACPTPSSSSCSSYAPGPALTPPPFFRTALVQERNKLYLVMEFCAGGDLAHYLRAHRRAPEAVARHFLRQLAAGLQEMWAHHLVHVRHRPTPPCYCCLCCRCCWPPRGVGTPSRPV